MWYNYERHNYQCLSYQVVSDNINKSFTGKENFLPKGFPRSTYVENLLSQRTLPSGLTTLYSIGSTLGSKMLVISMPYQNLGIRVAILEGCIPKMTAPLATAISNHAHQYIIQRVHMLLTYQDDLVAQF